MRSLIATALGALIVAGTAVPSASDAQTSGTERRGEDGPSDEEKPQEPPKE